MTIKRSTTASLATQVAGQYRQMILSGRLKSGDRLPTIRCLARELSVSPGPINSAFRTLEAEGLVRRRTRLGTFVGHFTHPLPASLEISVVFRPVSSWTQEDRYGLGMFDGIQHGLTDGKHRTVLHTRSETGRMEDCVDLAMEHASHGYIVDDRVSDALIERLTTTGRPVVVINRGCSVPGVSAVFRDNAQAGAEAARQLLRRGHRVTGCISRADWNGRQTAEAFLQEMFDAGFALQPNRVVTYGGSTGENSIGGFVTRLLCTAPMPTAIYCTDDRLAGMVYWAVKDSGLRIGEALSLVGTLDLGMAALQDPPLTTFRFDPERIGRAAVEELVARCRDTDRPAQAIQR